MSRERLRSQLLLDGHRVASMRPGSMSRERLGVHGDGPPRVGRASMRPGSMSRERPRTAGETVGAMALQ